MTPVVSREDRRGRLSALRRLVRVERRVKGQEEPPDLGYEARMEDVEDRLTIVEGRVDRLVVDAYRVADEVMGM